MSTQQTQHAQIQGPPWALDCNTIKVCLKTPVRGVISHSLFLQTKRINRYRVRLRFCHIPSEDRKFYTELGWGLRNRLAQTLLEPEQHISNCSYLMISNLFFTGDPTQRYAYNDTHHKCGVAHRELFKHTLPKFPLCKRKSVITLHIF